MFDGLASMKSAAVFLVFTMACTSLHADTVWLKNGDSIKANKTVIKGDQLEYIVGTTTYHISLSQVDHIDKTEHFGIALSTVGPSTGVPDVDGGASRGSDRTGQSKREAPTRSGISVSGGDAVLKKIVVNDRIDERALSSIESEGNARNSAAAYAVAANYEYSTNRDADQARRYLGRALEFAPDNVPLLCWYSSLLVENGDFADGTAKAEYATQLDPNSADAQIALGSAYYATNRLPQAVAAWKLALNIRPDEGLKQYVTKVEKEIAVEENFHEKESSHFTLRFEGRRTGFTLAGQVLNLLETQYGELSQELGYTPQSTITVVLYTEKEFFDVTDSPSWSGGLNDGKLRIPVKNVTTITNEFDRVLKHELTHTFVHFITRGNCPTWINEGVAQLMEPRNAAAYAAGMARVYKEGKQIPLSSLEGSFMSFDESKATVAYAESLLAIEYIRSGYGMTAVRRMLEQLGTGASGETAVHNVTGADYERLEQDLGSTLKAQFYPKQQ